MEYISEEQFLKQPKEIQKVFIDWWKPSTGDLFIDISKIDSDVDIVYCVPINNKHFENYNGEIHYKIDSIPLLSEGQLRKCIEDKTNCYISCSPTYKCDGYDITILGIVEDTYTIKTDNLLEAYWKVACEIAKEE
ncbi:hypothetical protein FDC50_10175 [Clostridium botulinum]|nr:hypothetical protein KU41_17440 [Clostridium botulinum]KFX58420.1 hypothetical protein KU40_05120 [Clostridium botulinum]MBY6778541.1 hypothetical protein [Clostridium botulinum]MBY6804347.1 hypothetical protein [Clostridium botulinum]MBY6813310.1 hypothetical protein [Clostridium botulinum]